VVIDLAPPSHHVAGRWALALVVVGYLAGRVRSDAGSSAIGALVTVAACSFVGTSIFALSGMVLHDPSVPVGQALRVIPVSVLYDVLLAPFLLPLVLRLHRAMQPPQVAY
jgi:rod shape-determining protein MreD